MSSITRLLDAFPRKNAEVDTSRLFTRGDFFRIIIIASLIFFLVILCLLAKPVIVWDSFKWAPPLIAALALIWLFYGVRSDDNKDVRISRLAMVLGQAVLFSNVVVIDNYLGLYFKRQLYDRYLAGYDAFLGFDWWRFLIFSKSDPFISSFLSLAYNSSGVQLFLLCIALNFAGKLVHLEKLALACMIAATVTVFTWIAFPSFGHLPLRYAAGLPEPHFALTMSKSYALALLQLRENNGIVIDANHFVGLIGFPSFHTILAILTIYGAWAFPRMRVFVIAWNLAVLFSIPSDGGHHFVDLIGGGCVAVVSILVADLLIPCEATRAVPEGPA